MRGGNGKRPRDGVPHDIHKNTQSRIWTGMRNLLEAFRGVSKWYLDTDCRHLRVDIRAPGGHVRFRPRLFGPR